MRIVAKRSSGSWIGCAASGLLALGGCGSPDPGVDAGSDAGSMMAPDAHVPEGDGGEASEDTGIAPADAPRGPDAPPHECEPAPDPGSVPTDLSACGAIDGAITSGGLTVHELTILDPAVSDPARGITDPATFVWSSSPISFRLRVSAPGLAAGATATLPVTIGLVPLPTDWETGGFTVAQLDDPAANRACPIATVFLGGVGRSVSEHTIELANLIIPDRCLAAGTPLIRESLQRPLDDARVAYYANLYVQPRRCDDPSATNGPRTYLTRLGGSPMHAGCVSPSPEVSVGTGCVWDVPVYPTSPADLDVRVADCTATGTASECELHTPTCVASLPDDEVSAVVPLIQSTLNVMAFGAPPSESGRTAASTVRPSAPVEISYTIEPSRLAGSGDRGDALLAARAPVAALSEAATSIAIPDFVLGVAEPHDHALYAPDALRTRLLRGDWAGDTLFTITGCLTAPGATVRDVDCGRAEVFLDRRASPPPALPEDVGGAGGPTMSCVPSGTQWVADAFNSEISRGNRATLRASLTALSRHRFDRTCVSTENRLTGRIEGLNGALGYDFLTAHVLANARSTSMSTAVAGEARVRVFSTDRLGPVTFAETYRASPSTTTYMSASLPLASVRFVVWVVPVQLEVAGFGRWGLGDVAVSWGPVASPVLGPFPDAEESRALVASLTPGAQAGLSISFTDGVFMAVGVTGTMTLLDVSSPLMARIEVGRRRDGRGLDGRLGITADIAYGSIGAGQLTAWANLPFFGRSTWALASLPGTTPTTVRVYSYATPATTFLPSY